MLSNSRIQRGFEKVDKKCHLTRNSDENIKSYIHRPVHALKVI